MNLNTTKFFNSDEVHISSRMNEYMKKNFGYEVEGDIDTLREAKKSLEAEQYELKKEYMSKKYVENMFMIETISALLKAHGEDKKTIKEDDDYMLKKDPATGKYDPDEIRQMQYQQNVADPLNREIDSSQKAITIEVDYDLELDKPKSQNPLLKKHYKEMRKFNVFISMPEWQEGPPDSGFGIWTAKVRGSKKNLLGWLKAWEFDYDKEELADMGLGESVKAVKEDDEEKGAEHYRWKNESQLAVALGRIESAMEELDHAIEYRGENSAKFFNNGDKAGVGSLMSIKGTLQKILDNWEKDTEFYGM